MSDGMVMPAARRGDRHSDSTRFDDAEGAALLGAVLGDVFSEVEGAVAALGAQISGGLAATVAQVDITVRQVVGRRVTGALEWVSKTVYLGRDRGFAALVDPDDDSDHDDDEKLKSGAAAVFVEGFRIGRVGDETADDNTVFEGDLTILVGGIATAGAALDPAKILANGVEEIVGPAIGAVLTHPDVRATGAEWAALLGDVRKAAASTAADVADAGHAMEQSASTLAAELGDLLGTDAAGALGPIFGKG